MDNLKSVKLRWVPSKSGLSALLLASCVQLLSEAAIISRCRRRRRRPLYSRSPLYCIQARQGEGSLESSKKNRHVSTEVSFWCF